jgi:hypothetical protein
VALTVFLVPAGFLWVYGRREMSAVSSADVS